MQYIEILKHLSLVQWAFYFLSITTLFGALGAVMSKNTIHSVLYLVLTFFSISGIYIMLNAQFLAAVNIIVYAGAIMVLFIFAIMFLHLKGEHHGFGDNTIFISALTAVGILGVILVLAIKKAQHVRVDINNFNPKIGLIENLGDVLYKKYMLPFELVSILFLIAMVGAVLLAKKDK
ncbi:MAG: NADH-quinone oxidoreductase subunit J [Cytophagaceae bacterium]|nr:NADH-quinone oxidoreductase subunit J [Cytophagaceae bacterium]